MPPRPSAILSIDAGQTGMKLRLASAARAATAPDEMVLAGVRTDLPLPPQLAWAAHRAVERWGRPIDVVSAGVSALSDGETDAAHLLRLVADLGVGRVVLAHDSVSSFLGTLGDRRGAVVAAGTGVVTLAVGRTAVARVDGWGYIMGDAGSGYWIGREALDAAMRAYDGRGPATALVDVVRQRWPALDEAYIALQGDEGRVAVVASFAEQVARLADADAVAARICDDAARELVHSVVTALGRVAETGTSEPTSVSAIGGVLRSAAVRSAFERRLGENLPQAVIAPARGTGLDGVEELPGLGPAHPLRALIADSAR